MPEHPERVRRRIVPDETQMQVILGSLLGGARIDGLANARRMTIAHDVSRAGYVRWKYERLTHLAAAPPSRIGDRIGFRTIAHPIFDELAPLFVAGHRVGPIGARRRIRELLRPLGLAVWMADAGRVEIRPELFVPLRRRAA